MGDQPQPARSKEVTLLATFRVGQKTHPGVPPQPQALEPVPADNPGSRDETGPGDHHRPVVVPGAGHGREEPPGASPGAGGVTPAPPGGVGETARECHPTTVDPCVFVLDRHGTPLQPTTPARARKLLASGRAGAARHTPFTIR